MNGKYNSIGEKKRWVSDDEIMQNEQKVEQDYREKKMEV